MFTKICCFSLLLLGLIFLRGLCNFPFLSTVFFSIGEWGVTYGSFLFGVGIAGICGITAKV